MLPHAHLALSAGFGSAVSAYYIRKRIVDRHPASGPLPTRRFQLQRRVPLALAAVTITGSSAVLGKSFDKVEKYVGGGSPGSHHDLHNFPFVAVVHRTAKWIKRIPEEVAIYVSRKYEVPDLAVQVARELSRFADWLLCGGLSGAVSHILGDLVNNGRGNTALTPLKPFSNKSWDIGLGHASPFANAFGVKLGAILFITSWTTMGAYLASRVPLEEILKEKFTDAMDAWDAEAVRSRLSELQAGVKNVASGFFHELLSLVRTTAQSIKEGVGRAASSSSGRSRQAGTSVIAASLGMTLGRRLLPF